MTSSPSDPNEDWSKFESEIARFHPARGSIEVLVRLAPGMQVIQPRVAGGTLAWIEGPQDLRAFGWKLHLTDVHTASDRVIANDSGARIANSVVPAIAFDGVQLVYTSLEQGGGGAEWRLHRFANAADTVIATLTNAAEARFLSLAVDDRTIAWSENVVSSDPHVNIGVYDIASSKILFRGRTSLAGVYKIELVGDELLVATQSGIFRTDRAIKRELVAISPEGAPVDSMAVVGGVVLYYNFNKSNTFAALDLATRDHVQLGQNVTWGPARYGRQVAWFEKVGVDTPARVVILDVASSP